LELNSQLDNNVPQRVSDNNVPQRVSIGAGTVKVVNTMFVNGINSVYGETTLLNVYDENLMPITMP